MFKSVLELSLAACNGGDDVVGVQLAHKGLGRGVALEEARAVARDPEDRVPDAAAAVPPPRDRLKPAVVRSGFGCLRIGQNLQRAMFK